MKNLFVVNIFSFLLLAACSKSNTECISVSPSRVFNTSGMHFYPETDSISMKDTLWVSFEMPKKGYDLLSKDSVDLSSLNDFTTYLGIMRTLNPALNPINDGTDLANNDFLRVVKIGIAKTGAGEPEYSAKVITALERDNKFQFLMGLVPTKTGYYTFGTNDARGYLKEKMSDCQGGVRFVMIVTNEDKHVYFFPNYSHNDAYTEARSYRLKVVK